MKGKEKATVGEVYALFETVSSYPPTGSKVPAAEKCVSKLAEELWPPDDGADKKISDRDAIEGEGEESEDEEDIEKAIAKEVKSMKRPRHEQRFSM